MHISESQSNSGRSLESNLIYQQYLADYASVNQKISALDRLPYEVRNQPSIQEARSALAEQQKKINPLYIQAYNSSTATLDDYEKSRQNILDAVDAIFSKAVRGEISIQDRIAEKIKIADEVFLSLNQELSNKQLELENIEGQHSSLKKALEGLQGEIDLLDGEAKEKAVQKYEIAKNLLVELETMVSELKSNVQILEKNLLNCSVEDGILDQLHQLASTIEEGSQSQLEKGESLLQMIKNIQKDDSAIQTKIDKSHWKINELKNRLSSILNEETGGLIDTSKVEHATWYIDWTSWDYPIPTGVNTVNLFVGNMKLDGSGNPVIEGFGNFSEEKMIKFAEECHAQGIAVKISLGGGGGAYDHCWSHLKPDNVSAFAKSLSDFCASRGIDGVDFDIEEFKSSTDRPEQQKLCGQLIKEFKELAPNLSTSLCTNAGFGPYFPWQGIVKNIFDAASTVDPVTEKKTSAVDRLYIMSYYNTLDDEKKWILGWHDWLKSEYGYEPHQITVGIDDKDAHAYDIKDMAAFAGENGFSTGYWEFDPAKLKESNQSTHDIEEAYQAHAQILPYLRG